MEIQHINKAHHFTAMEDGHEVGRMTYSLAGEDKLIINHTEVNPAHSGKGIGKKMVTEAIKYARKTNVKIIPLCPFAKRIIQKNIDLQDVLLRE